MDEEIERILSMSDEEILAEARAEGIDPEENAKAMRALVDEVVVAKPWTIHLVLFRLALGGIANQNMTIRELRRLLLANRKTGFKLSGTPERIAEYINGLPGLPY
jgi:hypothetical protein